jgi:hypothetical protein
VPCLESDAPVLQSCFSGEECNFAEFSVECQGCLEADEDEEFCFAPLFEAGLLDLGGGGGGGGGGGPPGCIRDQVDACESGAGRRRAQTEPPQTGGDPACSMADFDLMVIEDNWDAISDGCKACTRAVSNDRELFMGCFDYPDPEPGQCDNGDDRSAGCRKCMYSAMKSVCDCETSNCDGCIRSSCFAGGDGQGNDGAELACLCAMDMSGCDDEAMADITNHLGDECPDAPWAGGGGGDNGYDGNPSTA